jgi:hypothetical protein
LCKLDLQLSFTRTCTLRKDIENQLSSVNHATLESFAKVTLLRRCQFVIENDDTGAMDSYVINDFLHLTLPNKRRRVETSLTLGECGNDRDSSRVCQLLELKETDINRVDMLVCFDGYQHSENFYLSQMTAFVQARLYLFPNSIV